MTRPASLYGDLLGPAWQKVDRRVRAAHLESESLRGGGSFQVKNGSSRLARALVWLLRMPRANSDERVVLMVGRCAEGERWTRSFGGRTLVTTQSAAGPERLAERVGCLEFCFRLRVANGAIRYQQESVALCVGARRLGVPDWLAPRVEALEAPDAVGGGSAVWVRVSAPFVGPLLSYEGNVRIEG